MPGTYQQLRHKTQFRLLELQPATNDDDVLECRLIVRTLPTLDTGTEPFEYEAVSYVWGTELSKQHILLDGWQRQIGQNLWNFLRQARRTFAARPRLLWIDALCIDQANTVERNAQVQRMGAIYLAASRTLVWLGTGDMDATLAMNHGGQSLDNLTSLGPEHYPFLAVGTWLHLPYWSRTWIVQEFLISPDLLLMYGIQVVPVQAALLFIKNLLEIKKLYRFQGNADGLLKSPGASLLLQRLSATTQSTLASLIIRNQHSRCLEPRDKVYAVLSLIKDQDCTRGPIMVDYGCDIRSVFQDVLCLWSEQENTVTNLLQLGSVLAKILQLNTNSSGQSQGYGLTGIRASTMALPVSRTFQIRAYSVGTVGCHTAIAQSDHLGRDPLTVGRLYQTMDNNTRMKSWVQRCVHPDEFKRMAEQLTTMPLCATWLQRFCQASRHFSIQTDASSNGCFAQGSVPTLSLVGVSLSTLKAHHYTIGLALGAIDTGDMILQALCHEVMFVCASADEAEMTKSKPSPSAVLICARSGNPSLDRLTGRSMAFAAITSEAEIKSPPFSTILSFTVQEMLVLCGG